MNPREVAYHVALRIEEKKQLITDNYPYIHDMLNDPRDRRLVVEIVYGVNRLKGRIEYILQKFIKRKKTDDRMWLFMLTCVYQLLFLSRVPPYAVINESVNICKIVFGKHKSGFVNAVLKRILKEKDSIVFPEKEDLNNFIYHTLSFPVWLGNKWISDYGYQEALSIMKTMNMKKPVVFRAFKGIESLSDDYILNKTPYIENSYYSKISINILKAAHCYIMNEASQLIPELLSEFKGNTVLDATSSPGGKGIILKSFNNVNNVILNDISSKRTDLIRENLGSLSIADSWITCSDMKLPAFRKESLDAVLLDAPCSGTGTISGHPEIRWIRNQNEISSRKGLQKKLLANAFELIKPGGCVLYSVCSLEREEGEDIVLDFVSEQPNASFENPFKYSSSIIKERFSRFLSGNNNYLRIIPDKYLDGFFAAVIRKNK